ncbi:pyruvate dehydrogenase (acetyl-transferring) E1 component subunit alpha [Kordiimonas sp. SCSIO 12603]|uniref:pyruvate dehydrogenase (acetyl-transferring) E1 component subunit alpha n=1 Tax=Kordiimonas sp. SCSIO 12603 TaxID=2829596 RepID=UPI002102E331|nr:pyruvate dehydrogenase (acetyl-transferring) E1 component subunit alpha [Kordiimonas sp. SCSIO 12603]UTW57457.1 pyruvate dehydrogenase (acetyl-transferring) E1 component subunit alpha [Kordiimonas sp. SCSIO 12603]
MTTKKTSTKAAASPKRRSSKTALYKPTNDELVDFYKDMLLIRRFEEKAGQMYGMGLIGGFCHLYIGQEAVVVGVQTALKKGDSVITGYREHGHMLVAGTDAKAVMAELTGRSGGCSKGKGGSMHMFDPENGFYGGHGIVGAQVSLGTGLAFAAKYKKTDNVGVAYFGDGAANQGQVYESFNMAQIWNLPVVYIIENNQYAMGTSVNRSSSEIELYRRGESFRIPGEQVDGMNVLAVRAAMDKAVKHCREGKGPYILEMKTYRYRGHSMSDPAKYRSKEEVQKMRSDHDAIDQIKNMILDAGIMDEAALKGIDKDVKAVVAEAAAFAQECPEPDLSELYTDVLA